MAPAGITTSWFEVGTTFKLHLDAVLQSPLLDIQVLVWAEIVRQKRLSIENSNKRFIIFGFSIGENLF
jgi:hypothetical protein